MTLYLHKSSQFTGINELNPLLCIFQEKPVISFKRKQILYHEGLPAMGVYYLETGKVKIYKMGRNGRPYILFIAGAGEILNAECAFGGEEFATSAEMLEDGRIIFIEKEKFANLVQERQPALIFIANLLARRIHRSEEERLQLAEGSVRERMARALIQLSNHYGRNEEGALCISLQLSRDELASMIGTAPGTVMRLLKDFKEEGAIRLCGKRIMVERLDYLGKVAQNC